MWACGNAATPFIIRTIGMGLGLSIWGSANMLTGWSSAHFGILGVSKETVPHQPLNIAGALVVSCPSQSSAALRVVSRSYVDILLVLVLAMARPSSPS